MPFQDVNYARSHIIRPSTRLIANHRQADHDDITAGKGGAFQEGFDAGFAQACARRGPDADHHVPIREHGEYGIHASRENFAEENHVRAMHSCSTYA